MDMQNVSNLVIPEGNVNTIHNSNKELIWGRLAYDTKYAGNTIQNGTPTPSSPINVDVVTGTQTVRVIEKNAFNASTVTNNRRLDGSGNLINDNGYMTSDFIEVQPSTTYTYSRYTNGGGSAACCIYRSDKTSIQRIFWNGTANMAKTNFQFTTDADTHYIRICDLKTLTTIQVESGNVSTFYAPYQDHAYTVSLGSTELCKIDTYQDYIYKSGDDWYVHKECGHIQLNVNIYGILQNGNAGVNEISYAGAFYALKSSWNTAGGDYDNDAANARLSTNFGEYREQTISGNGVANSMVDGTFCQRSTNDRVYMRFSALAGKTGNEVKSILQEQGGTNFYYYLNTPTDTQITDTTLIGQLDAIHQFLTRYGYNSNVSGNLPIIIDKTDLS